MTGDPTESALLEMVRKCGVDDDFFRGAMERQQELPFDSDRKLMSTVYALHGVPTLLTKGAPDVLLERAVYLRKKQGSPADDGGRPYGDYRAESKIFRGGASCAGFCLPGTEGGGKADNLRGV